LPLTSLQRRICKLIAESRVRSGESYVAGGVALNEILAGDRVSRDIDLFHDTEDAVAKAWEADRRLLESQSFGVRVLRERPSFVEAEVDSGGTVLLLQWTRDSAFRFFPLVAHDDFGLVLHPFDLATNKVLALVGRLEVRDWLDTLLCHQRLQRFGYLAWAACGKDPGFSPGAILELAARSSRYSAEEVAALDFSGPAPDAGQLSRSWRGALAEAHEIIAALPPSEAGRCVLGGDLGLFSGDPLALEKALDRGEIRYHSGRVRGALPEVRQR
jgi:hypothetical protein